jgi:hypothetical protein
MSVAGRVTSWSSLVGLAVLASVAATFSLVGSSGAATDLARAAEATMRAPNFTLTVTGKAAGPGGVVYHYQAPDRVEEVSGLRQIFVGHTMYLQLTRKVSRLCHGAAYLAIAPVSGGGWLGTSLRDLTTLTRVGRSGPWYHATHLLGGAEGGSERLFVKVTGGHVAKVVFDGSSGSRGTLTYSDIGATQPIPTPSAAQVIHHLPCP